MSPSGRDYRYKVTFAPEDGQRSVEIVEIVLSAEALNKMAEDLAISQAKAERPDLADRDDLQVSVVLITEHPFPDRVVRNPVG